jgi:hypothetical protein
MKAMKAILLVGMLITAGFATACTAEESEVNGPSEDGEANGPSEDGEANGGLDSSDASEDVEVPEGTVLTFELLETLRASTSEAGDTFEARLADPIVVEGQTVFQAGAEATGRVLGAVESGRVAGRASLRLTIDEISHDEEPLSLATAPFEAVAESTTDQDAVTIGAGAGIGAAIGAVIGGERGAATGAAIGGGSGTAVVLATRGDDIEIPSGTRVNFVLAAPLEVPE